MKHLLLILLFVPFISIGQDMTYEDLISFENSKQIERFLIERNYERYDFDDEENIKYGYEIDYRVDGVYLNKLAAISITPHHEYDFYVEFMFINEEDYNRIYDVAKKELEFYDVGLGMALYYLKGSNVIAGFIIKEKKHYITLTRLKI